jgi:D-alanyl-lipoteichoic acid acyltransferase DltB (MBOAT superfamily)
MLETKKISLRYFDEGLPLIIQGMAKKLLIANNLAVLVHMGYSDPRAFGAPELWLFAYAFAFQIYFDFSGYTDIARGSALLFGYHIPINFNLPYCAQNISDFWHRWHISLSTWLRDYLFIPMGGSRAGRWLTYRNLMITMALGGLWHGASFNFLFWGVYHGLALVVHREFVRLKNGIDFLARFFSWRPGRFLSIVFTFHAVCIGWVFFRVHDLGTALQIVRRMLLFSPIKTKVEGSTFLVLQAHLPLVVQIATVTTVALLLFTLLIGEARRRNLAAKAPVPLKSFCLALLLFALVVFLPDGKEPFIYFQF